jgi:hypothetical protein
MHVVERNELSNQLTKPKSIVLLEKLIVIQLINRFCYFYGTLRSIAVFTRNRHVS